MNRIWLTCSHSSLSKRADACMYIDSFTVSALVDEFMDMIVGGRVQDTVDADDNSIALEIYANHRRHYLLLSTDIAQPRAHLLPDKARRGISKPSQLVLLFRRFVESGEILHVSQPPWERILNIDVDGPEGPVQIVFEPMERRANLLLVQNGVILDCVRRVSSQINRARTLLPNHAYQLPPAQAKADPFLVTPDDWARWFADADPKLKAQQVLTGSLLGFSPLVGREVIHRAGFAPSVTAAQVDVEALRKAADSLLEGLLHRQWQPGVCLEEGTVTAYAVYPLTVVNGWTPRPTLSAAMSEFYSAPVGIDTYLAAKEPVQAAIQDALERVQARLRSLRQSLTEDAERERLRISGELILACQYAIHNGQTELIAPYEVDSPPLAIALDAQLTPLENAQAYFQKYTKAKRALENVPDLITAAETEIAVLAQLASDLDLAANWPEIDEVRQALQQMGYWEGKAAPRMGGGKAGPLKVTGPDGYIIWVGRNSRQNEQVTFEKAGPLDLWLHVRGIPGAHVVVRGDGRLIPDYVIEFAASLAAQYSARRNDNRVEVDVTERRFVRRMKKAGQGMVTYRGERTISVQPRRESG